MKKLVLMLAMIVGTMLIAGASDASAQGRHGNDKNQTWQKHRDDGNRHGTWRKHRDDDNRGTWHKKDTHGYRNYGQYRRTQVGNRRFRTVRRYYWNGGTRRVRLTRVYY